jgi:tetratricopeptide (TPR) repeat protein
VPSSAEARALLEAGVALHRAGDLDAAQAKYAAVLRLAPEDADALHLSGLIAHQRGDQLAAWDLVQRARTMRPRSADIAYNLGRVALALQDWPAAVEANRAALARAPKMSAAACNLGIALVHTGDAVAGEASIRRALAAEPDNAASWSALGLALHDQAKDDAARAAWTEAHRRNPALAEAAFNLACCDLRAGDLAAGWARFGARAGADPASFANGGTMPPHIPLWRGEDLAGKTLLIWGEQGLGDQILFAGFLPSLAARKIVLACAPRLVPLFARAFPHVAVLPQDDALPAGLEGRQIDVQVPLADLGRHVWPARLPPTPRPAFLQADPERTAVLRRRYRDWAGHGLLVGLSWHSRRATAGPRKSLPLAARAPILRVPGVAFVSLQYGETEADLAAAGQSGVAVHADPEVDATHDLPGLAAQIAAVDLVITVSNTTAHLAGALGGPVWTLAPVGGGSLWYWFRGHDPWQQSPWYPAMRVYHQPHPGAWEPLLHRVKNDLEVTARAMAR